MLPSRDSIQETVAREWKLVKFVSFRCFEEVVGTAHCIGALSFSKQLWLIEVVFIYFAVALLACSILTTF